MSTDWESVVIALYQRNIIIALPATILVVKLLVRAIAQERLREIGRSLLAIPLDFVYIAIGLLLSAIARRDHAFIARYKSEAGADLAAVFLAGALIFGAVFITWCDRLARVMWGKFCAAWSLFNQERARSPAESAANVVPINAKDQMPLALQGQEARSSLPARSMLLLAWILVYWTIMIPAYIAEFCIGVIALGGILKRLQ